MSSILQKLRCELQKKGCNAFFIALSDPHLSEYIPNHYTFLRALSGFTGSNGTVVVTMDDARLWTDSRYWEQASQQLGSDFTLMRDGDRTLAGVYEWLKEKNATTPLTLACPLSCLSASLCPRLKEAVTEVIDFENHDFDALWPNRPALVFNPPFIHHASSVSSADKLARLRTHLKDNHVNGGLLLTRLDDIAWITNLRGSDIDYNPVFLSWAFIKETSAQLFVRLEALTDEVKAHLVAAGWELLPYEALEEVLSHEDVIVTKVADLNARLYEKFESKLVNFKHPVALWKSIKTPEEIAGLKAVMVDDGLALEYFIAEIKERLAKGEVLTENDAVDILHKYRSQIPGFIGESFTTIAAVNDHAALPHYAPTPGQGAPIKMPCVLLVDSGAHYDRGTTDTTRTWFLGDVDDLDPDDLKQLKADYRAVYQGMMDLMNAEFEPGTTGFELDPIARKPLQAIGADYGHGTGHGIGLTLNVHEAPPNISPRDMEGPKTPFAPGMIVSDEPGIYRPGKWGIRIENMLLCVEKPNGKYGFECLTKCSIDDTLMQD